MTFCTEVFHTEVPTLLRGGVPAFDLAAGLLIANLWHAPDVPLGRLLSRWPLPQIGTISYGAYLYHMIAWALTWNVLLGGVIDEWPRVPKFGLRLVVFFTLTFLIAALSHRFIERPFLRMKEKLRPSAQLQPPAQPSVSSEVAAI